MESTHNLNIKGLTPLVPPNALKDSLPMTERSNQTVVKARNVIKDILKGNDSRLLVIVGPCSIHDEKAAMEYAEKLNHIRTKMEDQLFILMRVYFEKPRTTIGWKGLISDPHLDGTGDIQTGLKRARALLLKITEMGMPTATELLDPITPQYIADLVSWAAIGARTTESQTHREMASGLSMPVGYKNATDGSLQTAIDAIQSSRSPHSFLGIDQDGRTCIVQTTGNQWGHIVLRGGRTMTNYDPESIQAATDKLIQAKMPSKIMVDCSHANSGKKHEQQELVWQSVIQQVCKGSPSLMGVMVESNLHAGNQPIQKSLADMKYGVSITDECIDWETTERMFKYGHEQLVQARLARC
jgi:3-deoxy-7-phosphoheptulonate synthase